MLKIKFPHFYFKKDNFFKLQSIAKWLVLLLFALFPFLVVLNYIDSLLLIQKSSPLSVLNTYVFVDLASRFACILGVTLATKKLIVIPKKKKYQKILVILLLLAIPYLYTTVLRQIQSIIIESNSMTEVFIYSLSITAYSIGAIALLWFLGYYVCQLLKELHFFDKLKPYALNTFLGMDTFIIIALIANELTGLNQSQLKESQAYLATYFTRFSLLLYSVLLLTILYWLLNKFNSSPTLITIAYTILAISAVTLNFIANSFFINPSSNYFLQNFSAGLLFALLLHWLNNQKNSKLNGFFDQLVVQHRFLSYLTKFLLYVLTLIVAYFIILLVQYFNVWLLKTTITNELSQLPIATYYSFFSNTLGCGMVLVVLISVIRFSERTNR